MGRCWSKSTKFHQPGQHGKITFLQKAKKKEKRKKKKEKKRKKERKKRNEKTGIVVYSYTLAALEAEVGESL